eukprot:scaffold955_cov139-Isochrysis_galbana.AAC.2
MTGDKMYTWEPLLSHMSAGANITSPRSGSVDGSGLNDLNHFRHTSHPDPLASRSCFVPDAAQDPGANKNRNPVPREAARKTNHDDIGWANKRHPNQQELRSCDFERASCKSVVSQSMQIAPALKGADRD